jgi:hypothetical protein
MNEQLIPGATIASRNNKWRPFEDNADVAHQALIEDGVNGFSVIGTAI